ncbi:hypothetical protein [Adhaeribacter aquaticus]|uniref:hypothetical protein n=1 Tax=Adhaeribacter aquaticus TaxID=299567 RepID=UPI00047B31B2|nr:hypothetical protein [Adhaeribacter aquaticus]
MEPYRGMLKHYFLFCFLIIISFTSCKPACPIFSCHTRKVHIHGGKEFRGQPIWKKQNPHIGEKMPKKMPQDNQATQQKELRKKK